MHHTLALLLAGLTTATADGQSPQSGNRPALVVAAPLNLPPQVAPLPTPIAGSTPGPTFPFVTHILVERFPSVSLWTKSLVPPPARRDRLAAGDLDGDGLDDLAWVRPLDDGIVQVALAEGAGAFAEPIVLPVPPAFDVAIANLDGIGNTELLIASATETTTWRFQQGVFVQLCTAACGGRQIEIGDVDGDERPDALVGSPELRVLRNAGDAMLVCDDGFAPIDLGDAAFAAGDIDGDGLIDVAVPGAAYRSTGMAFELLGTLPDAGPDTGPTAIGDVDGDGDGDVILEGDRIAIVRTLAGATIADTAETIEIPLGQLTEGTVPGYVATSRDVDRDGDDDVLVGVLAVSNGLNETLLGRFVLLEARDDGLVPGVPLDAGGLFPRNVVAGEFDGDGVLDIAVVCRGLRVFYTSNPSVIESMGTEVTVLRSGATPTAQSPGIVAPAGLNDFAEDLLLHDLDGDDHLDLLYLVSDGSSVERLEARLGLGDGTFDQRAVFVEDPLPTATTLTLLDIDGDGNEDIANVPRDRVLVPGSGDAPAGFVPGFTLRWIPAPWADVEAARRLPADLNGDGIVDFVGFDQEDIDGERFVLVTVQLSTPDGYGPVEVAALLPSTVEIGNALIKKNAALADLDGDGDLDMVLDRFARLFVPQGGTIFTDFSQVDVLRNDGPSTFTPTSHVTLPLGRTRPIVTADLSGTGRSSALLRFSERSTGIWQCCDPGVEFLVTLTCDEACHIERVDVESRSEVPTDIDVADVDGDGDLDLVLTDGYAGPEASALLRGETVTVRLNDGTGAFPDERTGYYGAKVRTAALGDLDGAARLDLVVSNMMFGGIWIARNQLPPACPGDADGSGTVDTSDLNAVLFAFGRVVPPGESGDVTGDGIVNAADLDLVLANWLASCEG